jgi:transporter family protein
MATLLRTVVVAIALALVLVSRGQLAWSGLLQLPGSGVLALALSGLATGLSWFCYNRALQLGPVAAVAALDKLSVVLVALLAWLVLGEPLGLKAWIGIVTMAIGATLVAWA